MSSARSSMWGSRFLFRYIPTPAPTMVPAMPPMRLPTPGMADPAAVPPAPPHCCQYSSDSHPRHQGKGLDYLYLVLGCAVGCLELPLGLENAVNQARPGEDYTSVGNYINYTVRNVYPQIAAEGIQSVCGIAYQIHSYRYASSGRLDLVSGRQFCNKSRCQVRSLRQDCRPSGLLFHPRVLLRLF